jgi:anti-sigma regulatory factor (Ser/Thr protein kinase)
MQETLTLRLSGGPTAPARARKALRTLDHSLAGLSDDVDLLVSELVTNSVRHASAETIEVNALCSPRGVRIEVTDPGPGFDPHIPQREPGEGGYGLFLVDTLADRWGVSHDSKSRVWAEIDRDSGSRNGEHAGRSSTLSAAR